MSLVQNSRITSSPLATPLTASYIGQVHSHDARLASGLLGRVPPRVFDLDSRIAWCNANLARLSDDLERYRFLVDLQSSEEHVFFALVLSDLRRFMPLIYTPTVGDGCQAYSHIVMRPRGLFIAYEYREHIDAILSHWPTRDVQVVVVTDGERILGLGDLGVNGMGIPVGKLALYTACAGVRPEGALPITLDVGTDTAKYLEDPLYGGMVHKRVRGAEYLEFLDAFMRSITTQFPNALIQFEDFAGTIAIDLLARYRNTYRCFNDDIQGTGAVAVAGLFAATRIVKKPLKDLRILFYGAGSAAVGIVDSTIAGMMFDGLSEAEARSRIFVMDSKGLIVHGREDLVEHKLPFRQHMPHIKTLEEAIRTIKPHALIGVSGVGQCFNEAELGLMAEVNERPIIFALSNPTRNSECHATQAYNWTNGTAVFASGSPFDPVTVGEKTFTPGQGNNAYIFPGVGLGAVLCGARTIPDSMFMAAARALSELVTEEQLAAGTLYPPLTSIRQISAHIALRVIQLAQSEGLATVDVPATLDFVHSKMYNPLTEIASLSNL